MYPVIKFTWGGVPHRAYVMESRDYWYLDELKVEVDGKWVNVNYLLEVAQELIHEAAAPYYDKAIAEFKRDYE